MYKYIYTYTQVGMIRPTIAVSPSRASPFSGSPGAWVPPVDAKAWTDPTSRVFRRDWSGVWSFLYMMAPNGPGVLYNMLWYV